MLYILMNTVRSYGLQNLYRDQIQQLPEIAEIAMSMGMDGRNCQFNRESFAEKTPQNAERN